MRFFLMLLFFGSSTRFAEAQAYDHVVHRVARVYNVPAGFLRGIWHKESSELPAGWRRNSDWHNAWAVFSQGTCVAKRLALYGGTRRERIEQCTRHWEALRVICAQRVKVGPRKDQRLCSPYQVRTSWAFAMGPMQLMPGELVETFQRPDGTRGWRYSEDAVDGNRDGVVDPHNLEDAMAMAAKKLRRYYAEYGSWRRAAERYYGSRSEGYYEGRREHADGRYRRRKGVRDHWYDWCRRYSCPPPRTLVAAR